MKNLPNIAPAALALSLFIAGCNGSSSTSDTAAKTRATKTEAAKGPGRVAVEHGLDVDASKVDQKPQSISVEDLLATRDRRTGSVDLDAYHDRRVAPFETTTYEVKGILKSIKHEKDGDFYFVLQGKSGAEAVIEVPDPKLCAGSPLEPKITSARKALDDHYHPTGSVQNVNEEVTVDGVGFLGSRRKPGSGNFGSSVRLMPGTGIKFDNKTGG